MSISPESQTGVALKTKYLLVSFLLAFFKPKLVVDGGEPVQVSWGETFIPLAPGRHQLRVFVPYLWYRHMGDSTQDIEVAPGQVVHAQWKSPWLVFLRGKWTFPQGSAPQA